MIAGFIFFISSCARILHNPHQGIKIHTDTSLTVHKLFKLDSSRIYKEGDKYFVRRNNFPLLIQFRKKDSSLVNYYLKSELSPTYIYLNAFAGMPLSWIIDYQFDHRYRHKPINYFSYDRTYDKINYSSILPTKANDLRLWLGWSFINGYHPSMFNSYPNDGNVTPLGLNGQADYFVADNRSWMLEFGVSSTVVPKRKSIYALEEDSVNEYYSTNLWVLLNHRFHYRKWSIGAGLSIAPSQNTKTTFYVTHRDTIYQPNKDTVKYHIISEPRYYDQDLVKLGLNFNIAYNFNHMTSCGFNWQCYVSDINRNKFYASHFFNLYLGIKIYQFNVRRKPILWK
ncbi:MAG: hypothetical protein K0S32_143 [Bacteroidetes bacterium]|jgi:hypothetical protein|nr:hypothetical protein [Bacteroidota bacterium]